MTISEAMSNAKALTGSVVDDSTLRRWLSELDGQLAFDFWGVDAWAPYSEDDDDSELLVNFPWDGDVYVHYLEAKTYYSNGEYDRASNAMSMYNNAILEFRKHVNRTHFPIRKCCRREAHEWNPLS